MNRAATSAALALALALPATGALAQRTDALVGPELSWSYFDIGLNYLDPDSSSLDASAGASIRGSGMINRNWHLFLGWSRNKFDGSFANEAVSVLADDDADQFNIGIGYNLPVATASDLFARVAYERVAGVDFSATNAQGTFGGKIDSTNGYSVEVGIRTEFTPRFEGGVSLRYLTLDTPDVTLNDLAYDIGGLVDDDDHLALKLLGQYKFGNGWGVVGEAEIGSGYNALFVGARLSY